MIYVYKLSFYCEYLRALKCSFDCSNNNDKYDEKEGNMMVKRQILSAIESYDTIIIHRHVRPDPDAIGSQNALKEMLKLTFPNKTIYAVGEEDDSLTFLARMDDIRDATYEGALVIVCDTANTSRVCDQRYTLGDKIIKIDHHPNEDPYGDINWVDTSASSTSEMIYELFLSAKDYPFKINDDVARLIYAGIVGDTGRFLFPSTNNKTFAYASELIAYNFDRTELYNGLYEINVNIARLRGYILQQLQISENGAAALKLTKDILEKFDVEPIETSKLVGTYGEIKGLKAWVIFIEEDDLIRVRLRSKGPVINTLASKYNGGGHPLAAGATVYSWEEADQLVADLEAICKE